MPRKIKPNLPKGKGKSLDELSGVVDDLQTTQKIQGNDITTLKWVVGIGSTTVLVISSIMIAVTTQFGIHLIRENATLRADHNNLRVEFEVYKAQNPPVAKVPPKNSQTPPVVIIPPKD